MADAGCDSEANHRFCREHLGVRSLIPAKKRRSVRVVATTPYRQEMVRLLGDPGDEEARRTYRQRWKAETVMSVVERRCGEALSARLDDTQRAQALLRGVVYNLNRLIRLGLPASGFRRARASNRPGPQASPGFAHRRRGSVTRSERESSCDADALAPPGKPS